MVNIYILKSLIETIVSRVDIFKNFGHVISGYDTALASRQAVKSGVELL